MSGVPQLLDRPGEQCSTRDASALWLPTVMLAATLPCRGTPQPPVVHLTCIQARAEPVLTSQPPPPPYAPTTHRLSATSRAAAASAASSSAASALRVFLSAPMSM